MAPGVRRDRVLRGCRGSFTDLPDEAGKRESVGLRQKSFRRKSLRAKPDFLNALNVIWPVHSCRQKYSASLLPGYDADMPKSTPMIHGEHGERYVRSVALT
jgi:hypothetical protein